MWEWLQNMTTIYSDSMTNIFYSIGVLILILLLKHYTKKAIHKQCEDAAKQYMYGKISSSIYIGIYLIGLLIIWNDSSSYIIAFLGMFSAGLAIAMKEVLINVIGGMYILWTKPFRVGDRIEIGGQIGDVVAISTLRFTLLEVGKRIAGEQSTGRTLDIPNMMIFSMPLANYEKGFKYIWHEVAINIDKESDWELAKELLYKIVDTHTNQYIEEARQQIDTAGEEYLIFYNNLTPIIYTEIKGGAILLTIRYLCEPRKARTTEHLIWEDVLTTFKNYESIKLL